MQQINTCRRRRSRQSIVVRPVFDPPFLFNEKDIYSLSHRNKLFFGLWKFTIFALFSCWNALNEVNNNNNIILLEFSRLDSILFDKTQTKTLSPSIEMRDDKFTLKVQRPFLFSLNICSKLNYLWLRILEKH